jgi:glucose-1-phosphatase
MIKINALLFDLGGVVLDIDFDRAFACWAGLAGVDAQSIKDRYRVDEAYRQHERGTLSGAGYLTHLRQLLGVTLTDEALTVGWNQILRSPITGMPDLLARLRQHLPIYIFSNTNDLHVRYLNEHYRELFAPFRKVFVSSELGLRKPELAAFLRVAELMNCPPEHILFFDDLAENVAGARQVGLHAVQVTQHDDVILGLKEFGLIISD